MNYMKWHSISAVVMAVSAAVCIYDCIEQVNEVLSVVVDNRQGRC